jgi:hypothetical protein
MADNTTLNTGSGGDTLRTEDRTTFKVPVSLIDVGGTSAEAILGDASVVFPAYNTVKDGSGTFYCPLVDSDGHLQVDVLSAASTAVTNAGTFVVQIDGTALTRLTDIETNTDFGAVTGGGVEASALRVTIANDSTGLVSVDDGGSSLTVDGTVTANLSATDNAVLDNIDTNTTGLAGTVSGSELQVDVVAALPAGTNAIGKLAANSGVDIGDVDVLSLPARDNATDTITASLDTAAIMNDTTALTPKFAAINATTNGDNTAVAAVVGKKVRVLSYSLVADAAVGVAFEDGAGGSELSGQMAFAANGGISVPFSPVGHFETTANTILNIELDAAANVRGHVTYVEV